MVVHPDQDIRIELISAILIRYIFLVQGLSTALKKGLSGAVQELLLALMMTPARFDAHRLRQSMEVRGSRMMLKLIISLYHILRCFLFLFFLLFGKTVESGTCLMSLVIIKALNFIF